MKKTSHKIVFFGSGPVAARSLELLAESFEIEAVVTKPQPPHHRESFPVITTAEALGLKTLFVTDKQSLSELFAQRPVESQVGVLIDFGIIVSQDVIDYFPLGIVNSHFSILPEHRGADPITFSILSGQETTGVSLMLLVKAMDEGPLLAYGEQTLAGNETTPQLTQKLILLSDALIRDRLPAYLAGNVDLMPQSVTGRQTSYSRRLKKDDGVIDWQKPAEQLEREIRAFIEWPKSRATMFAKDIVITESKVVMASGQPGEIETSGRQLIVYCGKDALQVLKLKPAGKPEMTAEAFLAGYKR